MLIVMHGPDDFTSRESLQQLLQDPRFAYNIERFDGTTADPQAIRLACETLPFLAEGRLVVVDGLPKAKRGESSDSPAEPPAEAAATPRGKRGAKKPSAAVQAREFPGALAEIASEMPASTTLAVLVTEELPKTHALLAAAAQRGKVVLAAPRTGAALDQWIVARARAEGVTIAPDAAHQLGEWTTGDLRLIANEVAKLATYVGPGSTIDRAALQLLGSDSRESRTFDLTDALLRGQHGHALQLLHALLEAGEAPLMLLAMITRQVRQLAQIQDLVARGRASSEIAQIVGGSPYMIDKTIAQIRRFTPAQIHQAFRACLEVDTALKRSRMAPDLALDLLVTEFGRAR